MQYAISAEHLGRSYGEHWAVRDLTIHVAAGEVFGLLGPNGAGKTSTMRMLACLVSPSTGVAQVCGFDIREDPTEVRRRTGLLTDTAGLYDSLSVRENLDFFAKLHDIPQPSARGRVEHYLRLMGLWDRRDSIAGQLSSGLKQKLSMARALLHDPPVVLLDEPTANLDPEGTKLIRDSIAQLKGQGRTIVLSTHNLTEAQQMCDRVAVIKQTLLRVGTPRQLQTSLYGRQVEIRLGMRASTNGSQPQGMTAARLNDLAVSVAAIEGVGDVGVAGDRLLISMEEPEAITPEVVRFLVLAGAEVLRVAEIEHSLERAYLDLVKRHDEQSVAAGVEMRVPA